MKFVSLFSGIGGLDLGLTKAGHEVILMCESDPGAQQVLAAQFPGIPLVPDVRALLTLPKETELLAAGFPCVDISRAGLRKGIYEGGTSGTVRHAFRLLQTAIADSRPVPWVLLENVEALLDRHGGEPPAVQPVVATLEALGYQSWAQRVVCSAAFGLPNRRRRVFIVAAWSGDARDVLLAQGPLRCAGSCCSSQETSTQPCYMCHEPDTDVPDSFSVAMDLGNARSSPGIDLVPTFTTNNRRMCLLLATGQIGMLRIEDAERLQGLPEGWTKECWPIAGVGVAAHRVTSNKTCEQATNGASYRFQLIGNAVTVPVAEWLGRRLMRPYAHKFVPSPQDGVLSDAMQTREDLDTDPELTALGMFDLAEGDQGILIRRAARKSMGPLTTKPAEGGRVAASATVQQAIPGLQADHDGEEHAALDLVEDDDEDGDDAEESQSEETIVGGDADGNASEGDDAPGRPTRSAHKSADRSIDRWPKAAWWLRGGLRMRSSSCEAPVKAPLQLLHDFIQELGPLPRSEPLNTYINRLKEHGWNVYKVVEKALMCGAALDHEITNIVRLQGRDTDKDSIGRLVWAPSPTCKGVMWPAEALDPAALPPCRSIPREALSTLNQTERLLLQQVMEKAAKGPREGSAGPKPEDPSRAQANRTCKQHKLFVLFLGNARWSWIPCDRLLDYAPNEREQREKAEALRKDGKLLHPRLFDKALEQIAQYQALQRGDVTSAEFAEALAQRASTSAATVNNMPRCRSCEACVNMAGSVQKRCLLVRAYAAAASGHTGAQLAVMGDNAVGARLMVWWPLDEAWYEGSVTSYDCVRVRHTVHYKDGDIEMIPLWAPNQMVRLVNKVADFKQEALAIQRRRAEAEAAAAEHRNRLRQEAQVQPDPNGPDEQLTPLEQARRARIRENAAVFQSMMAASPQAPTPMTPVPHTPSDPSPPPFSTPPPSTPKPPAVLAPMGIASEAASDMNIGVQSSVAHVAAHGDPVSSDGDLAKVTDVASTAAAQAGADSGSRSFGGGGSAVAAENSSGEVGLQREGKRLLIPSDVDVANICEHKRSRHLSAEGIRSLQGFV